MENFLPEVVLCKAFSGLPFGAGPEQAEKLFGAPEETQVLEDETLETASFVMHYWEHGFSLFFDLHKDKKFTCAEVDNEETLLFGASIFDLDEKKLVALMKSQGFAFRKPRVMTGCEKRLSFDDVGLDCYFENGRLTSINFGIVGESDAFYYFPN